MKIYKYIFQSTQQTRAITKWTSSCIRTQATVPCSSSVSTERYKTCIVQKALSLIQLIVPVYFLQTMIYSVLTSDLVKKKTTATFRILMTAQNLYSVSLRRKRCSNVKTDLFGVSMLTAVFIKPNLLCVHWTQNRNATRKKCIQNSYYVCTLLTNLLS